MKIILNNNQIIDELLRLYGLESDNQLAIHFGVERQQIRQFRNAARIGLNQAIVTGLIFKIGSLSVGKEV